MHTEDSQMSRKEREEEFRRNLVLDAAEELFSQKGFDGATVADIAQASELAKGSVYQLFQSKEEIIAGIIRRKMDRMKSRLEDILSKPGQPTEKIRQVIMVKLDIVWESREFARIFFHELRGFHWCIESPLMQIDHEEIVDMFKRVENVIKEAQRIGEIRSDISSGTLMAAMDGFSNGIIFSWLMNPEEVDVQKAATEVQELFLNGAKADERRPG